MKKRTLGKSGLDVSAIGLGCMGMSWSYSPMHYNFARVHKTLRVTPAMEAGLADHVRSIEEIVGLLC